MFGIVRRYAQHERNPVAGALDRLSGNLLPAAPKLGDGSARHPGGVPRKRESQAKCVRDERLVVLDVMA
jgi:hypothetical protein